MDFQRCSLYEANGDILKGFVLTLNLAISVIGWACVKLRTADKFTNINMAPDLADFRLARTHPIPQNARKRIRRHVLTIS